MKTVQLAELGALAEDIRRGETIEIVDGQKRVAKLTPEKTDDEILDELERKGIVTRGSREPVPDWFFTERPPKFSESVLEQLLKDRHSKDY